MQRTTCEWQQYISVFRSLSTDHSKYEAFLDLTFIKDMVFFNVNETNVVLFLHNNLSEFLLYEVFKSVGTSKIWKIFINSITVQSQVDIFQELDLWVQVLYNLFLNDSKVL